MLEQTLRSIIAFEKAIAEDPRTLVLKQAEAKMMEDPQAKALSSEKDRKNEIYEEKCRLFGEESQEAKQAYSELYHVKCELDELPVVKEYQRAYNALHLVFFEVDQIVFGPFRNKKGCAQ